MHSLRCVWVFQWTEKRERSVASHSQSCLTELAVGLQCLQNEDRETQKAGTELVVRLQCHARHVGGQVETGIQDLYSPFPETQGTNLDSIGSWTPMLSAATEGGPLDECCDWQSERDVGRTGS